MSFSEAITTLNRFKQENLIRDFAFIGAVASAAYPIETTQTEDLDIVILVDTDEEYYETFGSLKEKVDGIDGMHLMINGVPVQMFPSTLKPLYLDTLHNARSYELFDEDPVKVASPEHLIILALEAFRPKDKVRIPQLVELADPEYLRELLERFDDEKGTLKSRLREIP